MESTMRARTIVVAIPATQVMVTFVDAKKVMKGIPTIPLAAQVNFYSFNVTLSI
jgi:hypothetical protein